MNGSDDNTLKPLSVNVGDTVVSTEGGTQNALDYLATKIESIAKQASETEAKAHDIIKMIDKQDTQIATVQTITTLGFVIALITLAGVIIAFASFVASQVHQTNQQTTLLQEINDRISK